MSNQKYKIKWEELIQTGIDTSLLQGDFKQFEDYITCPICLNVVLDPVCCSQCTVTMCKICIDEWVKKKNSCPNRCENYKENKLDRLAAKLLSTIKIKCVNFSKKCEEIILYENYINHIKECKFTTAECNFCKSEFAAGLIEAHVQECDFEFIQCKNCDLKFKKKDMTAHINIAHSDKFINCKYCSFRVNERLLQSHYNICDKNITICDYCELVVNDKHNLNNCIENTSSLKTKYLLEYEKSNNENNELSLKNKELSEQLRLSEFKYQNILEENNNLKEYKKNMAMVKSKFFLKDLITL